MKKLLLAAATVFALTGGALSAGGAHAATYLNLVGGCACGLSSYGTVTVTGEGSTQLDFDIELASGVFFNQAGNGIDESFSLVGSPVIDITSISDNHFGTVANNVSAGTFTEPSNLGDYMYHLTWLGNPNNNGNLPGGGIQSLKFTVTSASNLTLAPGVITNGPHVNPTNFFFTVDVSRGPNGPTGQVGGVKFTPATGAPEPAAWAMMLVGFGGLGAVLRRRRMVVA